MTIALPLPQQFAPREDAKVTRPNVYYPQARVTLSVIFENFGDPKNPKTFPVQPRSITVYSNNIKEADTWSVEFDARDLPISPQLIRGGSCEIYLFQTPGIGQSPEVLKAKDNPLTPLLEGLEPTIVGLFDEVSLELSDNGRTVSIDGTDYTALFIAKQWPERKRIPSGQPLDRVVKQLMSEVPGASAMSLEVLPISASLPIVGGGSTKTNKKGIPATTAQNYWDVIYDLSLRHGFIVYVQNLKVRLVELEAFIKQKKETVRKMAWGRNLTSLRMSRRIGKEQVPIVECRSYDDVKREIVKARFPKDAKQKPITGLGTKRDEVQVVFIPGIRSQAQLEQVAKQIYYVKARSEQKIEIETMDLSDMEGNDLIELRSGDAMTIGFDPFNGDVEMLEAQTIGARVQTLKDLGYDADVAAEIAQAIDKTDLFRTPFRVREATLEWSHDGGLSIAAELENYVNTKNQPP